jgi:hypothetical protein
MEIGLRERPGQAASAGAALNIALNRTGLTECGRNNIIAENLSPPQNSMKRLLFGLSLAMAIFSSTYTAAAADDLVALAGKWSVKKTNDQGDKYSQTLEIKKDKFVFQILGGDDQVTLRAEGDIKLEKLGPFNAIRFFHIRAGGSASSLDDVEDEYVSVYVLDGDNWTLASNFDKQREQQKPSADSYRRVKAQVATKAAKAS